MLQVASHKEYFIQKLILIIYNYMDYVIPIAVILTLPFWILPALIYYTNYKLFQLAKCIFRMGNHLVKFQTTPNLAYAILKGNGRYLREEGQDVHKKQFYDYTSRRFMTLGKFQSETRIIELECQTQIGLEFFAHTIHLGIVAGIHSNHSAVNNSTNSLGLISQTNYEIEDDSLAYDCLMLFDLKNKMRANRSKTDLLTILTYCRHHMDKAGYLVYGDYFQPGEVNTYISIFQEFKFIVADQEDITKNIQYAAKLANKQRISFEQQFIDTINSIMSRIFGRLYQEQKNEFIVFILEKGE